jgi:hypothetical protein
MLGAGIGVGIHGDGLDAHATGGGGNAAGDLAAVGNQNLVEHANPQKAGDGLNQVARRRPMARKT